MLSRTSCDSRYITTQICNNYCQKFVILSWPLFKYKPDAELSFFMFRQNDDDENFTVTVTSNEAEKFECPVILNSPLFELTLRSSKDVSMMRD